MKLYHWLNSNTPLDPFEVHPDHADYYIQKGFLKSIPTDEEIVDFYKSKYGEENFEVLMNDLFTIPIPNIFLIKESLHKYVAPEVLIAYSIIPAPKTEESYFNEQPTRKNTRKSKHK